MIGSTLQDPKLADVAPVSRAGGLQGDVELLLWLINSLFSGEDRRDGIDRFLGNVARLFPGKHFVFALGTAKRCKLLIDSRLGPLSSETPEMRRVAECWPACPSHAEANCFRLPLSGKRDQFAWLLVEDVTSDTHRFTDVLHLAGESLGRVLWSRPRIGLGRSRWGLDRDKRLRLAVSALTLALFTMFPIRYRVSCDAVVQPLQQRLVAAPFDAELDECLVRPGDRVQAEQELARLDGRALRMQRESLRADLEKANKEHDVALAGNLIADGQLARLESERIHHQLRLIDDRLAGLTIRSPMDGIVVSGDLRKAQGMPFQTGDPMFEVAPLDQMVFEVEIPELDLCYVQVGSDIRVRVAALSRTLHGRLERIYPQAEIRGGRNVFVGLWTAENDTQDLRPGMEASVIAYGPIRPLAWGWLRRVSEMCLKPIGW